MKNTKPLITAALFGIAAFGLSACGDEVNTTEQIINNSDNVSKVDSKDDLPACTDVVAGQTAFVVDDKAFYGCNGEDWNQLDGAIANVGDNICTSVPLDEDDGDGYTIICNGDTVGVIRNGEDGKNGVDGKDGTDGINGKDGIGKNGEDGKDGKGCTIKESSELSATIACGSETFTLDLTGYVPAEEDEECNAEKDEGCAEEMKDVELGGASQKGPFVSGTDVTAYELLNGRTLKQTGKTFGGKIENEDGSFNIKTVKLSSQYAYLVADGYYRNEVSGKNSNSAIKLRALTNLKGRKKANINLITHLEYDRIVNLVTKEGKSVANAKRQAEKEIFAAFNINSEKFEGYAEDYNILEPGDGNAALLAISILLQSNHSESQLTAILASLSVDLGDDGIWGNITDRTKIADWAMEQSLSKKGLQQFRDNVKSWGITSYDIPDFEKHINNFWENELNIPSCGLDSNGKMQNANLIVSIANSNSAYYARNDTFYTDNSNESTFRLICDASTKQWREASDIEKDTYGWGKADKEIAKAGNINKSNIYVFENDVWRYGTDKDADPSLGPCTAQKMETITKATALFSSEWFKCTNNEIVVGNNLVEFSWRNLTDRQSDTVEFKCDFIGQVKKGDYTGQFYFCDNAEKNLWRIASEYEADTYNFKDDKPLTIEEYFDGVLWKGAATATYYVNDSLNNQWRKESSILDHQFGLGGCTQKRSEHTENGNSYPIGEVKLGDNAIYYLCKNNVWTKASIPRYDTYGKKCDRSSRKAVSGNIPDSYYFCEADSFRVMNASEAWALKVGAGNEIKCGENDPNSYTIEISRPDIKSSWACDGGFYKWDQQIKKPNSPVYMNHSTYSYKAASFGNQVWLMDKIKDSALVVSPYTIEGNGLHTFRTASFICDSIMYAASVGEFFIPPIKYKLPTIQEWEQLLINMGYHLINENNGERTWTGPYQALRAEDKFNAGNPTYPIYKTGDDYAMGMTEAEGPWFWAAEEGYVMLDGDYNVIVSSNKNDILKSVRCIADIDFPAPPAKE